MAVAADLPRVLLAGVPAEHAVTLAQRLPRVTFERAANVDRARQLLSGGRWALAVVHHSIAADPEDAAGALPLVEGDRGNGVPQFFLASARLGPALAQALVDAGVERILVEPEPLLLAHEIGRRVAAAPTAGEVRAEPATAAPLAASMAALWERFRPLVHQRLDALDEATVALLEGRLDEATRAAALREAHKLTGSLGTYGLPAGSGLAAEAEVILSHAAPEMLHAQRLAEIVERVRQEVERGPARAAAAPDAEDETALDARPLVVVASRESTLVKQLNVAVPTSGWQLAVAASLLDARHLVRQRAPDAVILDEQVVADAHDAASFIAQLSARIPPLPVIVLADDAALDTRVMVARAGVSAILPRDAAGAQLMPALQRARQHQRQPTARVLAVDDDPQLLAAMRATLEPRGIALTTLDDPLLFWDTLEDAAPDVVVLDVDMPRLSGIDLCQVVRNDPRWSALPVLFLTARRDDGTVLRIFESGADDYISKPLVGPELVARITARVERVQLYRHLAETDALTGLDDRRRAQGVMERFLRLASRQRQPFSLVVIEADGLAEINQRFGHAAGDRVLRQLAHRLTGAFGGEDVIARWGASEFVVGVFGMTKELAALRTAGVLEALAADPFTSRPGERFDVSFAGGVAEFPGDADDLAALHGAAEEALRRAKAAGGARVVPVGADPDDVVQPQSADVLLVEDDEALIGVLQHTLGTHGFTTAVIREGPAAVAALTGPWPMLRVRTVLLDVDLPGLDGLSVLRRLAREGVLRHTRVIMLTARTSESEVLAALDLGAFDHVAKPFSVPILVHRVRRAMGGS